MSLENPSQSGQKASSRHQEMQLHAILHNSRVNGPGRRTVVFTQGCSLRCEGCFNPLTHEPSGGQRWTLEALFPEILSSSPEGVTFSGGEPTDQLPALLALCEMLKAAGLSLVVFSGRTRQELEARTLGQQLLHTIDVLIDGRYEASRRSFHALAGSSNQRIHLLTSRHTPEEFSLQEIEVTISPQGELSFSGFPSELLTALSSQAPASTSQGEPSPVP